ncbi:M13 family metallopeptidase [Bombilactobacillus thymidiniphilus]|uniref:M13 family peptidase n=1 Tax=Bombilactobacillus thymidiniphilus TaxID=2923363 RepID=A0ABY4PC10_9LACO|nr:M13-type metalloendopeptidase [Bombilactobacillus thymidiniphilus]UQS83094.1 M13 family peptidase [Bombilactobacillus thymidiniphilus]
MNNQQPKILGGSGDTTKGATATYKDNLYLAVNGEWLKTAQIPADKSRTGGFSDLDLAIEKQLMQAFADWSADKKPVPNDLMQEAVKLYQVAADTKKRDQDGFAPAQAQYDEIKNLSDLQSWVDKLPQWLTAAYPLPFAFYVTADMKDTSKNVVDASAPNLILPDKTYYADDNESGKQLLNIYQQTACALLEQIGETSADAQEIVTQALRFDRSLVEYVKSAEEKADYVKDYNPTNLSDLAKDGGMVNFRSLIEGAVEDDVQTVNVSEPRYYHYFTEIVNEKTFGDLRAWTLVRFAMNVSSYLSQDLRQTAGKFSLALSGNQELQSPIKQAYHVANAFFDDVVGQYYGQTYFGAQAKRNVEQMVHKMIKIYQQRIENNDWLSEPTKQKAIVKLDKMVLKIGYPEKLNAVFQQFTIESSESLWTNVQTLNSILTIDNFAKFKKPVDRSEWAMPGQLVNACYDPSKNDITFPAGILQKPFYSLEQSASANYGGIGAVIAHEISHGFDNNGAQFDEYGNLNNWWTDNDYATFKELTQAMINEFDGLEFGGGHVNGTLVVSENVADAGGLSCALEATKSEDDVDLKAFFINWARVWRTKSTQQLIEIFLNTDVHAPAPLRANVQAQNMDDFYTTFDVREHDGMWLEPERRVNIW